MKDATKVLFFTLCLVSVSLTVRKLERNRKVAEDGVVYGPLESSDIEKIEEGVKEFKRFISMNRKYKEVKNSFLPLKTNSTLTNHTDTLICKACLFTFTQTHNLAINYGWFFMNPIAVLLCSIGLEFKVCKGTIGEFGPNVFNSLLEHYFSPEGICTKLWVCKDHFVELNADDYARTLLQKKPLNKTLPAIDEKAKIWRALHVSDIHTDPYYIEGSKGMCPDPLCCRTGNGKGIYPEETAGKWGYLGKCDLPMRTLMNFIDTLANDIKPDFLIFTGDNPSHDNWETNNNEAFQVTTLFSYLIQYKYNLTIPIYPALGNHEEYPSDQFNVYNLTRENPFLKKYGDLWRSWLGEPAYQSFIKTGYYTKKHLDSNLRIIAVNCMFCDMLNFYLIKDPTDPAGQIQWLEDTLTQAEKDEEVVYIIGHIPPGDSFYLSECNKRYNALIDRFSFIIRGQFYGHTHWDEFRVIHEYFNQTKPVGIVYTAPSLTSWNFLHPSFRVFDIDSNTKQLRDYTQFRFNLTKANQNTTQKPKWEVAYKATESFKVRDLTKFDDFSKVTERLLEDKELFNSVLQNFFSGGPLYNEYATTYNMNKFMNCRFKQNTFNEYLSCTSYRTWDFTEYVYLLVETLSGKWYKKLDN